MKKTCICWSAFLICSLALAGDPAKPFVSLDFNSLSNGCFQDASSSGLKALNIGGELCEGVDGCALRLPGGPQCVNIDLPEKYRALDALSLSLWVAPEEAAHQEIVTAAAEQIRFDSLPFMLRWRMDWSFIFEVTMADGERRCMSSAPCLDTLAYPKRKWAHVVATYDGTTSRIYVNGKQVATATFPKGKKSLERIAHPVKIGGHAGLFKGAVDNLRIFNRAISSEEVSALYGERAGYKPEAVARKIPGTIDGIAYVSSERSDHWMGFPLKTGWVFLSNTGEVKFWGMCPRNPANQWDFTSPLAFPGQREAREKFYKELEGNIEQHADGTALLELKGKTAQGLNVKQRVEITTNDEARLRYEITADKLDAPSPGLSWLHHLTYTAMRFVGHDDRGLITGNLMDLEGDLFLKDLTEMNLICSDNRLVLNLAPATRWLIHGTRNAFSWRHGYTTLDSEIGVADWQAWTTGKTAVLEFSVKLEADDRPSRLDRKQAREVTRDIPFDFSALYARDPGKLDVYPADRDVPIYMENEPVTLTLNIPEKALPASTRKTKWFHLVGTYNGQESRLYLNGKLCKVQSFGIDNKPLRLEGQGTVMIGGPQEPFYGAIDNVRIYRRVLNEAEAKAHFDERAGFKPGAKPDAVGGTARPVDPTLVLWLDFNTLSNGFFLDLSPLALKAKCDKGALCEGVDGAALHITNGATAAVDLPASVREFKALTVEAWVSPDFPHHSTIVGGLHSTNKYNGMPFSLRWRADQSFWLFMNTPDEQCRNAASESATPTILFPQKYRWALTNTLTCAAIKTGEFARDAKTGEFERRLALPGLPTASYLLSVEALGEDGSVMDKCATELAIAGEVPQPLLKPGNSLALKKVDEADLTADQPGHDFYSYSGKSKVVKGEKGSWRQTLGYKDCLAFLAGIGVAEWWANDWFGVRFKTEPGKMYMVEMEYPDRDFMSISTYFMEPKDDPADGKCQPILRTASGLFTGNFLPHDDMMKTFQTAHFASAPWVAVCVQNAHNGRPEGKDLAPASVKRITLYEVEGGLPKLDAPADGNRMLGVHCESGGLSLSTFGVEKFRGELGEWMDRPKPEEYYRHAYLAVANLIRYMRYRGDNTLFYGIYRYRSAMFPSRTFPGGSPDQDLPMLMARMFEKNGLKLVLTALPHHTLPTARLQEYSTYEISQGASGVAPVNSDGRQSMAHRCMPAVNPFHPRIREAYARLAAELGERYGKCAGVAGIAWLTGQAWWEPCLPVAVPENQTAAENEQALLGALCDDETMRQFEQWAKVTLPGKAGEPDRFKKRFEWIMANAKEQFKDFRCWGMAQTHLALKNAFAQKAPGKDYLAIDYYQDLFDRKTEWAPAEACRIFGSGSKYYRDIPGFVYCPYVPEANGCTHWEHSAMPWDLMPKLQKFISDDALAREWDAQGKSGRYLHRQFYEQGIELRSDPKLKWMWATNVTRLATCSYPQQGGRGYLLDFLLLLARGTPNYISYSWCDSTIPMGHEPEHQEFAAAYRALPPGYYKEADRQAEVFARYSDSGKKAFYVVNTRAERMRKELKTGLSGVFVDAVTGAELKVSDGKAPFDLQPYQFKVYLAK